MRVRSARLVIGFAFAALVFAGIGFGVTSAQQIEPLPEAELPDGVKNAGDFAPPGWAAGQPHPGQKGYETSCKACHTLSAELTVGPGFAGLFDRVNGTPHESKAVQQRLLEYVRDVQNVKDPYFKKMQDEVAGPGPQMTVLGGLPPTVTDREILDIIDYILRFKASDFNEREFRKEVQYGMDLVSGATGFQYGGPACITCHTAGPQEDVRGANVAGNIAHTYVLGRKAGKDKKSNYSDGLHWLLSDPANDKRPRAHSFYTDVEGGGPLNEAELKAVMTFFEDQTRQVGTEHQSNFLPIFGLILAALIIFLIEPGLVNNLFVEEGHEYVDGPYEEEHHDHDHGEARGYGSKPEAKAEAKPEPASPDPKPDTPPATT